MDQAAATVVTRRCIGLDCQNKAGSLQCPTCLKLGKESFFCSQDCFKRSWVGYLVPFRHTKQSTKPTRRATSILSLRPVYPLSPKRSVPASIPHPDYANDGIPRSERKFVGRNNIKILDKKEQDGMRKACRLGREVLDIAAKEVRPGVTTDYIDEIVHKASLERNHSVIHHHSTMFTFPNRSAPRQDNLARHAESLTERRLTGLRRVADSILWSFTPEENAGIFYSSFNTIIPASLPFLFDGLNPLFEHFLFSKNIDLSRRKPSSSSGLQSHPPSQAVPDAPLEPLLTTQGEILDLNVLSQLSFFMKRNTLFRRLRLLYSGGDAGFSMGSFEQKVFNWRAPSILLVAGTRLPSIPKGGRERAFADSLPPKRFLDGATGNNKAGRVVFGVYLNVPWKQTYKRAMGDSSTLLFQLEPIHEVFHASLVNTDYATFAKSGISFGSPPPRPKPVSGLSSHTTLGPVSLMLDESLGYGVFTHDAGGGGAFHPSQSPRYDWQDRFEIESLEVWGRGGDEEAEKQRAAWAWEEREAAARRNIQLGKDVEADRALLEMAGLLGNHGASGGSMG
ncbi:TLDc domain [Lasallia pustulata]|uniref:TLDc domain n=1 Tax=Lasallia pustulata TaxID=136370 RepID=A0A1W5CXG3_9LECA|nr:TLDc domain [Lasallia pustulata]